MKLGPKMTVSRVFSSKNLKAVVVFIKTGVFLLELEALHPAEPEGRSGGPRAQPGVRPPTPPKNPGFNETTTGFKLLVQKTREYRKFFVRVLLNTVHKKNKNMSVFHLKPFFSHLRPNFLP